MNKNQQDTASKTLTSTKQRLNAESDQSFPILFLQNASSFNCTFWIFQTAYQKFPPKNQFNNQIHKSL